MENASKALLIAGGVLIALITIALLVRSFSSISSFQKFQLDEEEQAQLLAFNGQYSKYLNQYVYGTEVLSLQNKYKNDKLVSVNLTEGSEQPTMTENQYKYDEESNNYSNQTRYYKCTAIGYDETTGRVNSITFHQIKMNSIVEEE